jgi:hypothetical protein
MKRTGERMRQSNGINRSSNSLENGLALEKGRRFLQMLSETAARSDSGSSVF